MNIEILRYREIPERVVIDGETLPEDQMLIIDDFIEYLDRNTDIDFTVINLYV